MQAFQIGLLVGHGLISLGSPQSFAQAFHHGVFGVMGGTMFKRQLLINGFDAGGSVCADLFVQGDMHAHMQEGVGFALVGQVVFIEGVFVFQQTVVFGV